PTANHSPYTTLFRSKRLLEKKPTSEEALKVIHDQEGKLIQNRLAFDAKNTQLRSGYRNVDEFVSFYPFVPYQIELLQLIFTKIRSEEHTSELQSRFD